MAAAHIGTEFLTDVEFQQQLAERKTQQQKQLTAVDQQQGR
jgi:hypothetical protein